MKHFKKNWPKWSISVAISILFGLEATGTISIPWPMVFMLPFILFGGLALLFFIVFVAVLATAEDKLS